MEEEAPVDLMPHVKGKMCAFVGGGNLLGDKRLNLVVTVMEINILHSGQNLPGKRDFFIEIFSFTSTLAFFLTHQKKRILP